MNCRCGYDNKGEFHPCHWAGYTCQKPAKIRFYNPKIVGLAGVQLKFEVEDTWACDEHWERFKVMLKDHGLSEIKMDQ